MTLNKSKILCPKCGTSYSIDDRKTKITGKTATRCIICGSRFFVEKPEGPENSDKSPDGITFLKSYFEKRNSIERRKESDRRKDIKVDDFCLDEFPHDIIPIFINEGKTIIGHISPGRREGMDRRKGVERRHSLINQ